MRTVINTQFAPALFFCSSSIAATVACRLTEILLESGEGVCEAGILEPAPELDALLKNFPIAPATAAGAGGAGDEATTAPTCDRDAPTEPSSCMCS